MHQITNLFHVSFVRWETRCTHTWEAPWPNPLLHLSFNHHPIAPPRTDKIVSRDKPSLVLRLDPLAASMRSESANSPNLQRRIARLIDQETKDPPPTVQLL